MAASIAQQIEQQEQIAAKAKLKLENLKKKAIEAESKRFQRLATKLGFFEVEVTDEALESALKRLVDAAGSPQLENTQMPG